MLRDHLPSIRFAAIFSQDSSSIDWACKKAEEQWGDIFLQSADIEFSVTPYYDESMGKGLLKRLIAFRDLVDPTELVRSKLQGIEWENTFRKENPSAVARPLNVDPGYLTEAKVVLMTTKDRDHRLYVGQGIYAEITLRYQLPGKWESMRWTYPDYKLDEYHQFFFACRDQLRKDLQQLARSS